MTRLRSNLVLLLVAWIWGSAFVAQSLGMRHMGALPFTGVRFLLGAAVVAPFAWREWRALAARGEAPGVPGLPSLSDAGSIGLLGVLLFLGAAMQQTGIRGTSVSHAGFLTALYVPMVPLLGWLMFGQRPRAVVWPAALGCVGGTWLLAAGVDGGVGDAGVPAMRSGDLWVIASSLPWALHVLMVGRSGQRLRCDLVIACGQFVVCGVLALVAGAVFDPHGAELANVWRGLREAPGAMAYAGIVSVGLGFTLQVVGQRDARPADAAILLSCETVFAALFGALWMGDRLGTAGLAGCGLILASVLLVQWHPEPASSPSPSAAP